MRCTFFTILAVAIGSIFFLNACTRRESNEVEKFNLETPLASYTGLPKTGSYWIYEDSATKEIDSAWVDSYEQGYFSCRGGDCFETEFIYLTIKSTNDAEYFYQLKIADIKPRRETMNVRLSNFSSLEVTASDSTIELQPSQTFYPEKIINTVAYKNVLSVVNGGFVFAQNIGLIRKLTPSKVYNLIRYHIVE